jgi:ubiquinone/menaquinone biosynthesis C-methylase UbiE
VNDKPDRTPDARDFIADARDFIADARGVKPESFDQLYLGSPIWEIARPQAAVKIALHRNIFRSPVVDLGCGTGENARFLAQNGLQVLAVDSVARAIELARQSTPTTDLIRFEHANVLNLRGLIPDGWAGSILDSGLFHVFSDQDRAIYASELARIAQPAATLILICFNEHETRPGPRRVTQSELRASLRDSWDAQSIEPTRYEISTDQMGAQAWMAVFKRKNP